MDLGIPVQIMPATRHDTLSIKPRLLLSSFRAQPDNPFRPLIARSLCSSSTPFLAFPCTLEQTVVAPRSSLVPSCLQTTSG